MKAREWMRALTPLGWLMAVAMIMTLLAVAGHGVGLRWDPLDLKQRRLDRALSRASRAESEAEARRVEAQARVQQSARLDIHHKQILAVERATVAAVIQARNADDADELLGRTRADRLHAHDRELCELSPELEGCAAAADPA
ncbi:hypothetical protein ABE444_02335 [Brevundimonas pondensis]|jgi:hypothetical protein|uniref:hypothetical protein n=1 Tax=Brevundimonas pondensis TaxID=2774189 RepID=UPI003207E59F